MEQPKPVGIWIRVSTDMQAKSESPEHHEQRARYYAESKGWKVNEVYHLEGVSGKTVSDHPEAKRMMQDVEKGHITGLIFSKLARLARNTRELLDFADFFNKHGADLISLQESIDTSTPAGRLFYSILASMSTWEREEIASRVAASVPIRARLGKSTGGSTPFGYEWKEKKLIPHPQEAPVRKLIYKLFAEHKRRKTVARLLNQMGHRTRNGSKFSDTTVERLLADPIAKGMRRANYTKSLGQGKQWKLKPETDWVFTDVEPIIPEDLWNQCNAILAEVKKAHVRAKPHRKAVHLFAGVAHCSCGQKMYVRSNTPKYVCPCTNKIGIRDLEDLFHTELKDFFLSPEHIAGYLEGADRTIQEKQELIGALERERERLKGEMEKVMKLYLGDQISPEGFGKEYKPLEERLKQLEEQLPALQGEIDFLKIKLQSSDEILSEARDIYTRWPTLEPGEKRNIVETITQKVVISQDNVTIDLCYKPSASPSPSEMVVQKQRFNMIALPFHRVELKIQRAQSPLRRTVLTTWGDHLLACRLRLKQSRVQAAAEIGVDVETLGGWERNQHNPTVRCYPGIIAFLGYALYRPVQGLPAKLTQWREGLGLSQAELAKEMGVNEATLASWERGGHKPVRGSLRTINECFTRLFGVGMGIQHI